VSLEGAEPEVHERLTGVPGSFKRTLEGLESLRQAGVHVHTNTTLNAANEGFIEAIIRLVAELGLERFSMNLIIPAGSASVLDLQVPYARAGGLVERARAEAWRQDIEFHWYSPTPLCLYNPLAAGLGNKSCAACDGLLSVSPSGDVLPCSSYPESVGSLLRTPFPEIWKSARARFFRKKEFVPRECRGCEDLVVCAGACPLYWSALGTAELAGAPGPWDKQESR
jgi:radical SAM protein with 4Fe4S-binding SPASM domain